MLLVIMAYPLADLPFSFAADTLLYPIDKANETEENLGDISFCGIIDEANG